MNLKDELFGLTAKLNESAIDYAVCGGLAMAIHGFVRATLDIDILIREEDLAEVEQLAEEVGFNLPSGFSPFDTGRRRNERSFKFQRLWVIQLCHWTF